MRPNAHCIILACLMTTAAAFNLPSAEEHIAPATAHGRQLSESCDGGVCQLNGDQSNGECPSRFTYTRWSCDAECDSSECRTSCDNFIGQSGRSRCDHDCSDLDCDYSCDAYVCVCSNMQSPCACREEEPALSWLDCNEPCDYDVNMPFLPPALQAEVNASGAPSCMNASCQGYRCITVEEATAEAEDKYIPDKCEQEEGWDKAWCKAPFWIVVGLVIGGIVALFCLCSCCILLPLMMEDCCEYGYGVKIRV